jgi:hypothetical protein
MKGLAFLWFCNPLCTTEGNVCELYWGSKGDIIATVFWFIAAMFIFCHYPTAKDHNDSDGVMHDMDPSRRRTTRPSVMVQEGDLRLSEPSVMTEGQVAAVSGLSKKEQQQQEIGNNSSTAESQVSGEDSRQDSGTSSSEMKAHIV